MSHSVFGLDVVLGLDVVKTNRVMNGCRGVSPCGVRLSRLGGLGKETSDVKRRSLLRSYLLRGITVTVL